MMLPRELRIHGHDPLLFGDGRPFGSELGAMHARTLPLPPPGTLAGFLRTLYGNRSGWAWTQPGIVARAKSIEVAGPLLSWDGHVVAPAPADAVVHEEGGRTRVMALRPNLSGTPGCNVPDGLVPLSVSRDVKPAKGYVYWPWEAVMSWLHNASGSSQPPPDNLQGLPVDVRTHIKMDPQRGTAEEGMLFSTEGLTLGDRWTFLARLERCWRLASQRTTPTACRSFRPPP